MNDADFEILSSSHLFASLDAEQKKTLSTIFVERSFEEGQIVFKEGEEGDALFVVKDGTVRVSKQQEDGDLAVICELGEGQTLGEMSLLSASRRRAEVSFVTAGSLWQLSRETFDNLENIDLRLWARLLKSLAVLVCDRLDTMNAEVGAFLQEIEDLKNDRTKLDEQKGGLLNRLFGRG